MNRHNSPRAWPRNESPAAMALVLIDFVLRRQWQCGVAVLLVTALLSEVLP